MYKLKSVSAINLLSTSPANNLLARGRKLNQLSQLIQETLPDPAARHCRVANLRAKTLVLAVDSPAWSARIRFHSPEILRRLQQKSGIQFNKTKIIVMPKHWFLKEKNKYSARHPISNQSAELILQTAESIDDTRLKKALSKLALRNRKNSD